MPSRIQSTRVFRSARRRKTMAARVESGVLTSFLPERLPEVEAQRWVERTTSRMAPRLEPDSPNAARDREGAAAELSPLVDGFAGECTS